MVGAGELASSIWKTGSEATGFRYRFNLFRLTSHGHVGQHFRPTDLKNIVQQTQVLAATLADDGCLPANVRDELEELAFRLDQITRAEN